MPKGIKGFQKNNQFGKTSWKGRRSYIGNNNPNYGKTHTEKVKEKLRILHTNEKCALWKGSGAKISSIHEWVRRRIPKPELCVKCQIKKAVHLSNTGHTYKRKLKDWEWLCGSCHKIKDANMKLMAAYLKGYQDAKNGKDIEEFDIFNRRKYYQPII